MTNSSGKPSISERVKNALLPGHHDTAATTTHHDASASNNQHNASNASNAANAVKHEAQAHHAAHHAPGQQHSNVTFHPASDSQASKHQNGSALDRATNQSVTGLATDGNTGRSAAGASSNNSSVASAASSGAGNVASSAGTTGPTQAQRGSVAGVQRDNAHTLSDKAQTAQSVLVGTGAQGSTGGNTLHHETHTITSSLHGIEAAPQPVVVDTSKLYTDFQPTHSTGGAWLQSLMQKMEAASLDIDRAAKAGQEQISAEAAQEIQRLVAENQLKQKTLISRMQQEARAYEADYNKKREQVIAKLDQEQAQVLATLQARLQQSQAELGVETQKQVEAISELARNKKMTILGEAQQQHASLEKTLSSTSTSVSVVAHPEQLTKHHLISGAPKQASETVERSEQTSQVTGEPRSSVAAGSRR